MIISAHIVDRREKSKVGLFIFFFFRGTLFVEWNVPFIVTPTSRFFFFLHLRTEAKVKTQSFL